jgi:hypothetical protein
MYFLCGLKEAGIFKIQRQPMAMGILMKNMDDPMHMMRFLIFP